ncbi:MAG: FAD-binding protein [Bacteroidales bacterium]|jgi:FAD/FMN-containing dehydrogenase/Fe-S oxidoreductase|nr:FAD-binding protein [Bacteroidales bacterium]
MELHESELRELANSIDGELKYDPVTVAIYSTDASAYREAPMAVTFPRNENDIQAILRFAGKKEIGVTVRAAGTSLAGQVVGSGIIVDISKHLNRILEINPEEKWARVEPGVVLDELNMSAREYGLFFGPETSTSSRCNIGGMVGNNACGSHSLVYGSTRDHMLELRALLSDGTAAIFKDIDRREFEEKCTLNSLEGAVYRNIAAILSDPANRNTVKKEYPDPAIKRRNTGYALDLLLDSEVFDSSSNKKFNFCKLIAGSEGTLAVVTEIKLNLCPLPPPARALVCVHLKERNDAFRANLVALKFSPTAVEMMDNRILELTGDSLSQRNNRFFIEGSPGALLIVEFARNTDEEIDSVTSSLIAAMKEASFGYAWPVIRGGDISKVWELRKAGLGVLSNMKGDSKPVSLIEDTAVNVEQLPVYMDDIEKMLASHSREAVFHAHIGSGELHLRPILNLKDSSDVELFRIIGFETAQIVKKHRGSLSGEHGDGRLRGEFIPLMIGEHNYGLLKEIKKCWDPECILNPGKIVDTPPMNTCLRYKPGRQPEQPDTIYDFSSSGGILRAAERCNGSADCRKSVKTGGVMCPVFMATGDEDKSPRARANIVREYFGMAGNDPWNHKEIYRILDLCTGCKGCKSECPSGVDIAKIKSEFLQHWYDRHGIPLRTLLIAHISTINRAGSLFPQLFNFFLKNKTVSGVFKCIAGFAQNRSIPLLHTTTLRKWIKNNLDSLNPPIPVKTVCLFVDEFTDCNDTGAGIAAIKLLTALNYRVVTVNHSVSARTFISKGMVRKASKIICRNIAVLKGIITDSVPLIGMEPSAILGFRDEYPELAGSGLQEDAARIAKNAFMIDEFLAREFEAGNIDRSMFTLEKREILFHGHCQQKAIGSTRATKTALSIPVNYRVTEIASGCCGMAGSFGYEKEHYALSNTIGELVLFPEIRKSPCTTIISAPGTSCRHHIKDGTGRQALHPAVVLYEALVK